MSSTCERGSYEYAEHPLALSTANITNGSSTPLPSNLPCCLSENQHVPETVHIGGICGYNRFFLLKPKHSLYSPTLFAKAGAM